MNVLITGAAGGLGRVLANECARRGYRLFLTDLRGQGLTALRDGLERQFDVTVTARTCDLTSAGEVDRMLADIDRCGIRFDLLLNIAGIDHEGSFAAQNREDVVRIVTLNNAATLRITHAVLERRRPDRPFTVVFVSSLASLYPMPLKATYAASKRFLLDFATALRQELKPMNARVLALCPGGLATTPPVLSAIAAQGIWGRLTTNPLEAVARVTLDRALAGRAVYIPGQLNRALSLAGRLLPRRWVAAAIHRRWTHAQRQWLNAPADSGSASSPPVGWTPQTDPQSHVVTYPMSTEPWT